MARFWVGFDVAKTFHWVCVIDEEGKEVLSRRVEATEEDLEAVCSELAQLGGERTIGIDLLGGPATLLEVVLLGHGESASSTFLLASPSIELGTLTGVKPKAILKMRGSSPSSFASGVACCLRSGSEMKPWSSCEHWLATEET